jgi:hypothetical protein
MIVSSETLSRLDGTWTLIENNTLVSIDVKTRKLEIEMVWHCPVFQPHVNEEKGHDQL